MARKKPDGTEKKFKKIREIRLFRAIRVQKTLD
jgi:hypothetical protein